MLNMLIQNEGIDFNQFYSMKPFNLHDSLQYPGNVIQYLMMQLSDECKTYKTKMHSENAKNIFTNLISGINEQTISTFTSRDCATTLHRIALCVSQIKILSAVPDFSEKINLLLTRLHKLQIIDTSSIQAEADKLASKYGNNKHPQLVYAEKLVNDFNNDRLQATPQAIANIFFLSEVVTQAISNGLWAIAKISIYRKDLTINHTHAMQLVHKLNSHRLHATPQALANTLWATAILFRKELNLPINEPVLSELVDALFRVRKEAVNQNIVNGLWALAGLLKANYKIQFNWDSIEELNNALNTRENPACKQDIDSARWSMNIIKLHKPIDQCINNNNKIFLTNSNTLFSNANNKNTGYQSKTIFSDFEQQDIANHIM